MERWIEVGFGGSRKEVEEEDTNCLYLICHCPFKSENEDISGPVSVSFSDDVSGIGLGSSNTQSVETPQSPPPPPPPNHHYHQTITNIAVAATIIKPTPNSYPHLQLSPRLPPTPPLLPPQQGVQADASSCG
ncbi:hypothetical protein M0802_009987 [Mischocyttarus mexicanus]|nr:hypothetical protein M0802_009987 [Mischocyttarus mexicanus]